MPASQAPNCPGWANRSSAIKRSRGNWDSHVNFSERLQNRKTVDVVQTQIVEKCLRRHEQVMRVVLDQPALEHFLNGDVAGAPTDQLDAAPGWR